MTIIIFYYVTFDSTFFLQNTFRQMDGLRKSSNDTQKTKVLIIVVDMSIKKIQITPCQSMGTLKSHKSNQPHHSSQMYRHSSLFNQQKVFIHSPKHLIFFVFPEFPVATREV